MESKEKKIEINADAKEYILQYLQVWIDELSKFPTSYRKGIVRAVYNKIDSIPTIQSATKNKICFYTK